MKFIDLFAGIGGFHIALSKLGCKCVFASDISKELQKLYKTNYGMTCNGDITTIDVSTIPSHDILCAGFPCQSFSKAGKQKGMNEVRGKLFDFILNILKHHTPQFIILENVRNILKHNNGKTWKYIEQSLVELGYSIDKKVLSPHHINIPQHRERLFIIGSRNKKYITSMKWIKKENYTKSVRDILIEDEEHTCIENDKKEVLGTWQSFLNCLPQEVKPYSPLWSMEFKADYPIDTVWEDLSLEQWQKYRGVYGYPLSKCTSLNEIFTHLPNYVITQKGLPPLWKQNYIQKNRTFYIQNKKYITNTILQKIKNINRESYKKLEWNCQNSSKTWKNKLIQFRGSGIRIKKDTMLPSLVTIRTQIPIIGSKLRYLHVKEGATAQSLPLTIQLPTTVSENFRVLGNMVNVELVYQIAKNFLKHFL